MPKNERYYSSASAYSSLAPTDDPFSSHVALDDLDDDYEKYRSGLPSPDERPRDGYEQSAAPPNQNPLKPTTTKASKQRKAGWSRRRKFAVIGGAVAAVVIIAIVLGVAIPLSQKGGGEFDPDFELLQTQVANDTSFSTGGATNADPWTSLDDGIGAGQDEYTYYSGDVSNFPDASKWISFQDMWSGNYYNMLHACKHLGYKKSNT